MTSSPRQGKGATIREVRAQTAWIPEEQNNGEVFLSSQAVGFRVGRDVIRVGADVGKFDKIRLRVLDNDIRLRAVKVAYGNGESEEIVYKAEVRKDELTRWLDLNSDQFIKEIQLAYDPRPNFKGTAYVEVYDQYAESWVGPQGEGKGYNQGCVLLGSQMAGFTIDRPTTVLPIADVTLILETDLGVRRLQQFDCLVQTAAWQADMT